MADNMDIFMHAVRIQESGDDYTAINASAHFGAYQFDISTWVYALKLAGLQYLVFAGTIPTLAPPSVQDAAARALMSKYYGEFGNSFYNVAEAWYGGPGEVGHPNEGGGPGYPTVGQYASQVIAKYNALGGAGGGAPTPPPTTGGYVGATLLELLLGLNQEATQRGIGDAHSREQAAAGIAQEAIQRSIGDAHSREQAAAGILAEATQRGIGDAHSREQAAAATLAETNARMEAIDHTRQQAAAGIKALGQWVDDSAAKNGYNPTLKGIASGMAGTLGSLLGNEHVDQAAVNLAIKLLVDLATVDVPLIRPEIERLVRGILSVTGLDKDLATLLGSQLNALLGWAEPSGLADVAREVGNRLNSLESAVGGITAIIEPLKDESDDLREIGSLAFNVALLGYFSAAIADPVGTANDTDAVLGAIVDPLLAPLRSLLGM